MVLLSMMFYCLFLDCTDFVFSSHSPPPFSNLGSCVKPQVAWQKMTFSPSWWILGSDTHLQPTSGSYRSSDA